MAEHWKAFQDEVTASLNAAGFRAERIRDATYWNGHKLCSVETVADTVAYLAADGLHAFLVESKATDGKRLPRANVAEHQEKALREFDAFHRDAHGVFAVNYYDRDDVRHFNRCFMVPVWVWDRFFEEHTDKSMPMSFCEDEPGVVECPRVKGSIFDMEDFKNIYL